MLSFLKLEVLDLICDTFVTSLGGMAVVPEISLSDRSAIKLAFAPSVMADDDFDENEDNGDTDSIEENVEVVKGSKSEPKVEGPFDFSKPKKLKYCPTCTLPPEFCEYGQTFEKCLPWILENCPEAVSEDVLSALMGDVNIAEGEEVSKTFPSDNQRRSLFLRLQ